MRHEARGGILSYEWFYLATPVLALVAVVDTFALGNTLREVMPSSPAALPVYGIIFGMPHIFASLFGFADPNVRREARSLLRVGLFVSATAVLAGGLLLSARDMMLFVVAATMVHVTQQQAGLALGAARLPSDARWMVTAWRTILMAVAVVATLVVGGEASDTSLISPASDALAWAGLALVAAMPLGLWLALHSQRIGGRPGPMLAYQATLTCAWLLVAAGFTLLGILLLRFVHDATAFSWYIRHAARREQAAPGANPLYRVLRIRGSGVPLSVLPLAIAVAGVFSMLLPPPLALVPVFLHYLIERRAWRRDGVLGRHLSAPPPVATPIASH